MTGDFQNAILILNLRTLDYNVALFRSMVKKMKYEQI